MDVNTVVGGDPTVGAVSTPAANGTSNGPSTYTAPAMVPAGGTVTVSACANADLLRCASAQVTITAPQLPDLGIAALCTNCPASVGATATAQVTVT
jgi:hypothetical protein